MSAERSNKKKQFTTLIEKKKLILATVIGVPLLSFALFSQRGLLARIGLEAERRDLRSDIEALQAKRDSLREYIRRLENDTVLIEQIARERYGMVRPGETVYKLQDAQEQ